MRKIFMVVLALIVAGSSLVFAGGGKEKAAGGEAGGLGNSLVLYSSMTDNDLNNLLKGFNGKYPGINVEVVNGSAGELTSRIQAESSNPQGDLMWGGLNTSDGDTYSALFEHWLSDYENEVYDDYKSINGFYNLDHLSTVVFCVNTDLEKELGLNIRGFADLLNPKLQGKIVLSDPNSSSAAWNNVANIMAIYGHDSPQAWDLIEKLLQNKMVIVTSSSVCFKAVADGEYVIGLTYEDGASTLLKSGAKNVKLVYPAEGASAFAFGCAVIKDAPHKEAAKAMVNYLMSADGQAYLGNALGTLRFTNKNAKYNSPYLQPTGEIKWVTRDIPWLIKNKGQVLEHWNRIYTSIKR
jgi:iron(III) transport system substrate-binding protein